MENIHTYRWATIQMQAYTILRAAVYDVLSKYDITPTHWSLLDVVVSAPEGIRQSIIAKEMLIKAPLVTVLVRDLERLNFIQSAANPFDTRAKAISTTPYGRKNIKQIDQELTVTLKEFLKDVTEEDMHHYQKVLKAIISHK